MVNDCGCGCFTTTQVRGSLIAVAVLLLLSDVVDGNICFGKTLFMELAL